MFTRNRFRTEMSDAVLQNSVIITNIFSYLPLSDLKNIRLVQWSWLEGSRLEFKKRSKVVLYKFKGIDSFTQWTDQFHEYVTEFPTYNHRNFEISTNYNGKARRMSNYVSRIIHFCSVFGDNIKSLKLHGIFGLSSNSGTPDLKATLFLSNIMRCAPNAEELNLDIVIYKPGMFNLDWLLHENIVLSSVMRMELQLRYDSHEHELHECKEKTQNFIRRLNRLTPNLTSVELGMYCSNIFQSKFLLEIENSNKASNKTPAFAKLDSYTQNSSGQGVLEALLKVKQPFRQLGLRVTSTDIQEDRINLLQKILDKHCHTLEVLKVEFREITHQQKILMPRFLKLRVLSFLCLDYHKQTVPRKKLYSIDVLNLKGLLESGPDAFRNTFPLLQSLRVWTHKSEFDQRTLDCFFPEEDNKTEQNLFRQITELKVQKPDDTTREEYIKWNRRLSKMFPNACLLST